MNHSPVNTKYMYHPCKHRLSVGLLLVCLFLYNCGATHSPEGIVYNISQGSPGRLDHVFSSVEIIPLTFAGDFYPYGVAELQITDDVIAILDNHRSLHIFSGKGDFISCSDSVFGQGPGELNHLMGFSINPYDNTIEILTPDRFLKYDLNYSLVCSAHLPTSVGNDGLLFSGLFDLSDTTHLLLPTTMSADPHCVFAYNSLIGELRELYSYADDVTIDQTMQTQCFIPESDNSHLWFIPPAFTGCIYGFDRDSETFDKGICFNLSESFISRSDIASLGDSIERLASGIFSFGKEIPLQINLSSDYIFLLSTSGMSLRDMRYYVVSIDSGLCTVYDIFENNHQIFPFINAMDKDYAYSIIDKDLLDEYGELLIGDTNDSFLSQIEPESLVLLKYKLR